METEDLTPESTPAEKSFKKPEFTVVGIGASAGGIKALKQLFSGLPSDPGMAFVVILHLSQEHESNLAAIIQQETRMAVTQVTETVKVEPNHIYVIPPAKHLKMVDGHIRLSEPERIKGRRAPIDVFFRTLAEAYGTRAVSSISTALVDIVLPVSGAQSLRRDRGCYQDPRSTRKSLN